MEAAMGNDVCRTCGACCAAMRVGFHESETTRGGGTVPLVLTEPWIPKHVRMRGTNATPPRCAALEGEIGKSTACSIYGKHPSPCQALIPSTPEAPNPWCDEAREKHGLVPLSQGGTAPTRRRPASERPEKPADKPTEKPTEKPAEAAPASSKPPAPAEKPATPAPDAAPPAPKPEG